MLSLSKRKIYSAINNNEFYVVYQPIYNNVTQLYDSAEVLLRWRTKLGVEISPADFITLAEHSGCIIPLTLHLFHLVRSDITKLVENKCMKISLNISGLHLKSPHFFNDILSLLKGMPADVRVIIEITESCQIDIDTKMLQLFNRLKEIGIYLSLDDFGSGYSNFELLSNIHFDYVKISGCLLKNIHSSKRALLIVTSSLALISELGSVPIIENVETQFQYDLFKRNSFLFQGFFFSKPLLMNEFLHFVQSDKLEPGR